MKHRKKVSGLVVLILVMLFLAGCGTKVTPPQPEPAPPVPEKIDVVVYYLKSSPTDFYLVREVHKLDKSSDLALTALNELVKGTPLSSGAYRVLPADTKVLGIKIDQGLATVDFSPEVLRANVGASGEALGITSIVNTLTELPNIQKVSFTVDGSVDKGLDWWGHVGLYEQPFSRDLSNVWEPAIWVTAPAAGQVVASPLKITGSARVFEATVSYRMKDANGNILATGFTTATEGAPGRGDFQGEMVFAPRSAGKGQLEVFWASPKDGSDQDVVVIPVEWK